MKIHRHLPIDPNDLAALHQELGSTLWLIQALEDTLAHLITIVLKVPRGTAIEEADKILDATRKGTLGKLLKTVKESIDLPSKFEERVDEFLKQRNWLVHRSWRQHHTDIYHPEKLLVLLSKINAIGNESASLNIEFMKILEKYVLSIGVKPEEITERANKTIDSWINNGD